ncbi:hypothetical protein [Pedobacter sp. MW01-1-1]|uniref:hypothetical protein n=1 Tax=Pedobacter sp. MW01-1-1 TaxID=3383027 RepID=UPI003FEE31D0
MKKYYTFNNQKIGVDLKPKIIRVYSSDALDGFFSQSIESDLNTLISSIQADYTTLYKKELAISNESLFVEILAHVHCEYIGFTLNKNIKWRLFNRFIEKLIARAEIVDCGERKMDSNRWVWDILSFFQSFFVFIFPKKPFSK